jgi:hypothetical protein
MEIIKLFVLPPVIIVIISAGHFLIWYLISTFLIKKRSLDQLISEDEKSGANFYSRSTIGHKNNDDGTTQWVSGNRRINHNAIMELHTQLQEYKWLHGPIFLWDCFIIFIIFRMT